MIRSNVVFLLLAFSTIFVACHTTPTTVNWPQPSASIWTIPAPGTIYIERFTDSEPQGTNVYFDTAIIGGPASIGGKPYAVRYPNPNEVTGGILYIAYELNNDISYGDQDAATGKISWQTYPTGGGSRTVINLDTVFADSTLNFDKEVYTWVDSEMVHTEAGDFMAIRILDVDTNIGNFSGKGMPLDTAIEITNEWFVPALGWMVLEKGSFSEKLIRSASTLELVGYKPH